MFCLQRDPVPLHYGSVLLFNLIFEDAAVIYNTFSRAGVVFPAGHEDTGNSQLFTFLKAQGNHPGGNALPALGGAHAVSDMAAEF